MATEGEIEQHAERLRRLGSEGHQPWMKFLEGRVGLPGGHDLCAAASEQAGLPALARREYQLALRDFPEDTASMRALASLLLEEGKADQARDLLVRLLGLEPSCGQSLKLLAPVLLEEGQRPFLAELLAKARAAGLAEPVARSILPHDDAARPRPPEEDALPAFSDADCARFHHLFSGREDTHARQWHQGGDTGYSPVHEPFTPAVARRHFMGACTIGVYPIRLDGTCNFCALDLDITKAAINRAATMPEKARSLRETLRETGLSILQGLRALGLDPLFEHSGYKGRHYWIFLSDPQPADFMHSLGRHLLAWLGKALPADFHLEFFPKQSQASGKGLGNLIKLPLGIHKRTGKRAMILDDSGNPVADPFGALRQVGLHDRARLLGALDLLSRSAPASKLSTPPVSISEEKTPSPPPLRVELRWTDADFDSDPAVARMLSKCPVLRALKDRAANQRTLTRDEQLVLIHTLGHLPTGPLAVNHLLGKCVDVAPETFMKDHLKGSPTSCPTIRKRIPLVTRQVSCRCDFSFAPDRYPTPALHVLGLPADAPRPGPARSVPDIANTLAACMAKAREAREEEALARQALIAALRAEPSRSVSTPAGIFSLVEAEGVEELRISPAVHADGSGRP